MPGMPALTDLVEIRLAQRARALAVSTTTQQGASKAKQHVAKVAVRQGTVLQQLAIHLLLAAAQGGEHALQRLNIHVGWWRAASLRASDDDGGVVQQGARVAAVGHKGQLDGALVLERHENIAQVIVRHHLQSW